MLLEVLVVLLLLLILKSRLVSVMNVGKVRCLFGFSIEFWISVYYENDAYNDVYNDDTNITFTCSFAVKTPEVVTVIIKSIVS